MKNSRLLITLFYCYSVLIATQAYSQNCLILYEASSSTILKSNKVKEVKIFRGDSTLGKNIMENYFFDKSGCSNKRIWYDRFSKELGPMKAETFTSKDKLEITRISGRTDRNGVFKSYEKRTENYTKSNKLIKSKVEQTVDYVTITQNNYDTANSKKVDLAIIKIFTNTTDTFQIISSTFDTKTKTYTVKDKKKGAWIESEKSITTFLNDSFKEYTLYKNGVKAQHYTKEELNKKKQNDNEDVNENPLPTNDKGNVDTVYTSDLTFINPWLENEKSKNKYTVILQYDTYDKKKIQYADVYYTKSGLIYRRIQKFNPLMNETYQYTFY